MGLRLPAKLRPMPYVYKHFHPLKVNRGHVCAVYCIEFDKSGRLLATGSDDKLVKIWSVETGRLVATLRGHEGDITDISIDPENKYIASGSNDNIVRVWSLRDFSPIAVLSGHTNAVTAVAFSPSPFPKTRVLLSTSLDGSARLWWVDEMAQQMAQGDSDVFETRSVVLAPIFVSKVLCSNFDATGTYFVTGCSDNVARVWAVSSAHSTVAVQPPAPQTAEESEQRQPEPKRPRRTATGTGTNEHTLPIIVTMALWSLDDQYVITALSDFTIKVWDAKTGALVHTLRGHTNSVYVLDSHPVDPRIIVSAGYDGRVTFWDINKGEAVQSHKNADRQLFDGHFARNGAYFAASDHEGFYTLYGTGPTQKYQSVPVEQFFETDYHPLLRDLNHWVLDEATQLPPHRMPKPLLCTIDGVPYKQQPPGYVGEVGTIGVDVGEYEQERARLMSLIRDSVRTRDEVTLLSGGEEEPEAEDSEESEFCEGSSDEEPFSEPESFGDASFEGNRRLQPRKRKLRFRLSSDEDDHSESSESEPGPRTRSRARKENLPLDETIPIPSTIIIGEDGVFTTAEQTPPEGRRLRPKRRSRKRIRLGDGEEGYADHPMKSKLQAMTKVRGIKSWPDWLTATEPDSPVTQVYIPQVNDEVVYFRQGHSIHIEKFAKVQHPTPPWETFPRLRAQEVCRVVQIEYRPSPYGIQTLLTLELLDTLPVPPSPSMLGEDESYEPEESLNANRRFMLSYHPTTRTVDFLVLRSRYESSLEACHVGRRVTVLFFSGKEDGVSSRKSTTITDSVRQAAWYSGTVLSVSPLSPDTFPDSKWDCLEVAWDDEPGEPAGTGGVTRVSPWESKEYHFDSAGSATSPPVDREGLNLPRSCLTLHQIVLTLGASPLDELVYRRLAEAVEELMEDGDSVWFRQPVSLKLVAGYTKRVFCPIDLSTMALRLRNLYYRSLHAFEADIRLMVFNAVSFNQPGSDIIASGKRLKQKLLQVLREHGHHVETDDEQDMEEVEVVDPNENYMQEGNVVAHSGMTPPRRVPRSVKGKEKEEEEKFFFDDEEGRAAEDSESPPRKLRLKRARRRSVTTVSHEEDGQGLEMGLDDLLDDAAGDYSTTNQEPIEEGDEEDWGPSAVPPSPIRPAAEDRPVVKLRISADLVRQALQGASPAAPARPASTPLAPSTYTATTTTATTATGGTSYGRRPPRGKAHSVPVAFGSVEDEVRAAGPRRSGRQRRAVQYIEEEDEDGGDSYSEQVMETRQPVPRSTRAVMASSADVSQRRSERQRSRPKRFIEEEEEEPGSVEGAGDGQDNGVDEGSDESFHLPPSTVPRHAGRPKRSRADADVSGSAVEEIAPPPPPRRSARRSGANRAAAEEPNWEEEELYVEEEEELIEVHEEEEEDEYMEQDESEYRPLKVSLRLRGPAAAPPEPEEDEVEEEVSVEDDDGDDDYDELYSD
ncbi:Bromodomain containing protein [Acanthamoeba castellanii str. Neff]|uniref:Bromodomain containing protein n=1 Tax=Acanthamoeba castellanii (strain ATCC 30010 / Neff) TaxID=1257118 RepID=L8GQR8_ACACF|nr:Bromodomain containing protein [Acanthamoeba castellanii str. Neff]ELR15499.1 Bromodomain containing protein [Acanthamoeba castellanii str. Neff]